ncbi:MAG: hypothetical protein PHG25_02840 [Candidatus Pacebacteria bacterium]|nr:hypothetical protein [Candidatus Paceibacterota bacterium]
MHSTNLIVIAIAVLTFSIVAWLHFRRHAKVELNDYVEILDYEEWRSWDSIQTQMEEEHHGWLDTLEVICSLIILENKGLIMHRSVPHVTAFGVKEVHEFRRGNNEGGEETPQTIIPPPPTHGLKLVTVVNEQKPRISVRDFLFCRAQYYVKNLFLFCPKLKGNEE